MSSQQANKCASLFFEVGCLVGFACGCLAFRRRLALDDLTGLPNQRAILPTLRRRIRRAKRRRSPLCIALLDIDRFKSANTKFGYAAADGLLQEFASRVGRECRSRGVDLLRYRSGDEFLLVLNDMDQSSGDRFLQHLAHILRATPFQIRGHNHCLSCTVGMRCLGIFHESELTASIQSIERLLTDCEERLATGKKASDEN